MRKQETATKTTGKTNGIKNKFSTVEIKMSAGRTKKGANPFSDAEAKKIIAQIIRFSRDYSAKSIGSWKKAVRTAENPQMPNRVLLYDLYEDLRYDLHYIYLHRKLTTAATGSRWNVLDTKTNAVDKDARNIFASEWFEDFVNLVAETFFFGHSLLQLNSADPATGAVNFELVPRKNVVPERGAWVPMAGTFDLKPYRTDPMAMNWLLELGKRDDLGMLNRMATMILYKKVGFICWSEFCERFGNPIATGKTNTRDKAALDRMEKFLIEMASSSYAIIDNAESLELTESKQTDAYNVYDKLIEKADAQMSKSVILSTMTGDVGSNGGNRALGDVHADSEKAALDAFKRTVEYVVNHKLFPLLQKHGFKLEGKQFKYAEIKQVSKDTFEQHKWLWGTFEMPFEFISETYGVPITGVKEVQAGGETGEEGTQRQAQKDKLKVLREEKQLMKMHLRIAEMDGHKH